jgi:hypothetical protein
MALYAVRRPRKKTSGLNTILVSAASSEAALAAAQAESGQVTENWTADLLSDLVTADAPARIYTNSGRGGLILAGERKPGG